MTGAPSFRFCAVYPLKDCFDNVLGAIAGYDVEPRAPRAQLLETLTDLGELAQRELFVHELGSAQQELLAKLDASRRQAMQDYRQAFPGQADSIDIVNKIFSLSNSEKAYGGMLRGLQDPVIMARRADAEATFQAALAKDPALQTRYGSLIGRMAELQARKRTFAADAYAWAAFGGRMLHAPGLPVQVVDTVGAGDSFDAGFVYGFLKQWEPERSLRLAAACGSLSARRAGGTHGQPTLSEALDALEVFSE